MIGSIRASLNRPFSLVWATLAKCNCWQRRYQAQTWSPVACSESVPALVAFYTPAPPDTLQPASLLCILPWSSFNSCNFSQSTESSNAGVDDEDADEYKCKAVTEEEFSATQALLARCASHQEARGKSHQAGPPPSEPPKSRLDKSNLNASENTSPATFHPSQPWLLLSF